MRTSQVSQAVGALAIVGMLGMAPQPSSAALVLSGCAGGDFGAACSLGELVGGGTININNTLFSGFTLSPFGGRAVNTSVIRVDPIETVNNPGFTLVDTANTLRAANGDLTQNDFSFKATVVAGNLRIRNNTLVMAVGDLAGAGSFTNVFEIVLDQNSAVLGSKNAICDSSITPNCANTNVTDLANFSLVTSLSVQGGLDVVSDPNGVAEINSITFQFLQVPEPASLALVALGIAGIGLSRRRRHASMA